MSEVPAGERQFVEKAVRRIGWIILLLVPVGAVVAAARWGGAMALAFAAGGLLAYANYRWIVAVVDALVNAQNVKVPKLTYVKLLLPVGLLALLLYVIFSRSVFPVTAFFAGLFLLVVGVLGEGIYEIVVGRRSTS